MKKITSLLVTVLLIFQTNVFSEDTELYMSRSSEPTRPKVLILFDTSGSMGTLVTSKDAYDPTITYPTVGDIKADRVYLSNDLDEIDQYFPAQSNRCADSFTNATANLVDDGFYTGHFRVWSDPDTKDLWAWNYLLDRVGSRWVSIARDADYVDCIGDIDTSNASNPGSPLVDDGYPDRLVRYDNTLGGHPFLRNGGFNSLGREFERIYTANYMNWKHANPFDFGYTDRLSIAKQVIAEIITENPEVDFGLQVFNVPHYTGNSNSTYVNAKGGRVVIKINDNMSTIDRERFIEQINLLVADDETPLCETLYEAYHYFAGLDVLWGASDWDNPVPARDLTAENEGSYISPLGGCEEGYVIIVTDGIPTGDDAATPLVDALPGIAPVGYWSGSRLDELAEWLYNNDIDGDSSNGTQRVVTYTIGYHEDNELLEETATKGGGIYTTTDTAGGLKDAFEKSLAEILKTNTSFSAPSVAVNSFNRSVSQDGVYMAMFSPNDGPRWYGNLKKLKMNDEGVIVGEGDVQAIDGTTGEIRNTVRTLWSTTADGPAVEQGGAGALLVAREPSTRVVKVDSGALGELEDFDTSNSQLSYSDFNASDNTEKNELIQWARGVDVDDEDGDGDKTDTRPWILGDPLHSRPLTIDYSTSPLLPNTRILMGTNHGVLHMFNAETGQENWAFMPKDLLPVTKVLRDRVMSAAHPYGIDGTVVSHIEDNDNNGIINGSDKVYIYVGLRRGGRAYYALDVTDPDDPLFMWKIDQSSAGFGELGQSWSTPVITKIPSVSDPVMIIGGGYDTNKDAEIVGTNDSQGRGVFIVNAVTGALIWSTTPRATSITNKREEGLVDSIPAPVAIVDSNGDNFTDRIYAADTGGNIWRIDMPGVTLPGSAQDTWSVFKLASLGGETTSVDRRFFNKPDVVQTRDGELAFDGVLLGSGNRSHPNATGTNNNFYMIRDQQISSKYHAADAIPTVITHSSLYNATSNVLQTSDDSLPALLSKPGWYISLERSGEKSLAPSVTLGGTVYFTTFSPNDTLSCLPIPGFGHLYGVNLQRATAVRKMTNPSLSTDSPLTSADRQVEMGSRLPDSVAPHFRRGSTRLLGVGGAGGRDGYIDGNRPLETIGTYWYQK